MVSWNTLLQTFLTSLPCLLACKGKADDSDFSLSLGPVRSSKLEKIQYNEAKVIYKDGHSNTYR
jgi:hypothetical protein